NNLKLRTFSRHSFFSSTPNCFIVYPPPSGKFLPMTHFACQSRQCLSHHPPKHSIPAASLDRQRKSEYRSGSLICPLAIAADFRNGLPPAPFQTAAGSAAPRGGS